MRQPEYFYMLIDKAKSGSKSGNLSSSNYGVFEANDKHFPELCGNNKSFLLYRESAKPSVVPADKVLIKVQADQWEIKHVSMNCTRDSNVVKCNPGLTDSTREHSGNAKSFKITVISQVMPNGAERLKQHALQEEANANKPSKPHYGKNASTSLLERATKLRGKHTAEEREEKPARKM